MIYSRSPNVLSFHIEIQHYTWNWPLIWYKVEFQDWKISDLVYMDIQLTQQHWLKTILFLINCVLPLSYIMWILGMFESISQVQQKYPTRIFGWDSWNLQINFGGGIWYFYNFESSNSWIWYISPNNVFQFFDYMLLHITQWFYSWVTDTF